MWSKNAATERVYTVVIVTMLVDLLALEYHGGHYNGAKANSESSV